MTNEAAIPVDLQAFRSGFDIRLDRSPHKRLPPHPKR